MTTFLKWNGSAVSPAPRAVALGVFDGLHIGHRSVIRAATGVRHTAGQPFLTACVLSLCGVPKAGARLLSPTQRERLASSMGLDEWWDLPFEAVRDLSPAAFVTHVLQDTFGAKLVCCGENFRFGKGAAGDAATLKALCEPLGIAVTVVPCVSQNGTAVSATAVREAVATGDMPQAAQLLGRPFAVCLPVSHGNRLGHTLGFPTVNQVFEAGAAVPKFGVYASLVVVENRQYPAVTNVGVHPTVGGCATPQAETWIAGYHGDLYGKELQVELIAFLRAEQRFRTAEQLKAQIERDKTAALSLLKGEHGARAVLFDFDDTLAHRPAAFLAAMKEMMVPRFPHIDEEELDRRARQMLEENRGGYVDYPAYFERFFNLWRWEGVPSSTALFHEFLGCFANHTTLFSETVPLLQELRRRGYRLGLVTNGNATLQNRKVDAVGLRPLLDLVTACGDEGVQKPHPEPFLRTAARLCVAPENCIFVGDYEPTDLRGAAAAGMQPVCIDVFGTAVCPEGVPVIHSPLELLDML